MNLTLKNTDFSDDGIFGVLLDEAGNQIAVTLQHAYEQVDGKFSPKIPAGTYECVRGKHQLAGMTEPFETFEITGVAEIGRAHV